MQDPRSPLPPRRCGGLGVVVALFNLLLATAGLGWLIYGLAVEWRGYVDYTSMGQLIWYGLFGLAMFLLFFSAIVTFTGAGWGFPFAAMGYVTTLWLWWAMFLHFVNDDVSLTVYIVIANMLALVVLNRFIWGLLNRRLKAAAGRRAGPLGVILAILNLLYGLGSCAVMYHLLKAMWLSPSVAMAQDQPAWNILAYAAPLLLPACFLLVLMSAHVTLDGRGGGFVLDILAQLLLVGLCVVIFKTEFPPMALVVYGAAALLLPLSVINRVVWGVSRGRRMRPRAMTPPPPPQPEFS